MSAPSPWDPWSMDRDRSDELTGRMPIVPHANIIGVDCCGCIVAAVDGANVELRCNECGAVLGVVQIDTLRGLLGLDCAEATCPQWGRLNTFPGFDAVSNYVCQECGKAVEIAGSAWRLMMTPVPFQLSVRRGQPVTIPWDHELPRPDTDCRVIL